jgi:sugar lactone lactonase YvrE
MRDMSWGRVGVLFAIAALAALAPMAGCSNEGPALPESPPEYLLDLGSTGDPGPVLVWPLDVAAAGDGSIYVCHFASPRVSRYATDGSFVAAWNLADVLGPEGPTLEYATLGAVAADAAGVIFVADLVDPILVRFDPRTGTATHRLFDVALGGLDVAADGTVYLSGSAGFEAPDGRYGYGARRIWKLSNAGDVLAEWTPKVPPGRTWKPGPLTSTPEGGVMVIDAGSNRVQEYDANGRLLADWGLVEPRDTQTLGLALGPDDRVYVSRWGVLQRRDAPASASGVIRAVTCQVEIYSRDGRLLSVLGSEGTDPGQFRVANGVAVDASGALYVADYQSHRVQKFAYP